ncbi:hypothetical protein GDO86_002024, partial [Hymenochirus boettgeri]
AAAKNDTCCSFHPGPLSIVLPPLLIAEFILGSLFNGLSLWIFCFHMKTWKSSTVYLFNLALADFLLMVSLPFRTDYYMRGKNWRFGDVPCRLTLFTLAMNRGGSVLFLTLVAVDRYFRVVRPHHNINSLSTGGAVCVACAGWLLTVSSTVFIVTKPQFGGSHGRSVRCESFSVCPDSPNRHDLLYIVQFFVSLAVVMFCSCSVIMRLRRRNLDRHAKIKRAVQCVSVVGVAFCTFYLPSVSTRIEILRLRGSPLWKDCNIYRNAETAFYMAVCLTYLNSMCNPLLYYFSSNWFKAFYRKIARCTTQSVSESEQSHNVPNTNDPQQTCNYRLEGETQISFANVAANVHKCSNR